MQQQVFTQKAVFNCITVLSNLNKKESKYLGESGQKGVDTRLKQGRYVNSDRQQRARGPRHLRLHIILRLSKINQFVLTSTLQNVIAFLSPFINHYKTQFF